MKQIISTFLGLCLVLSSHINAADPAQERQAEDADFENILHLAATNGNLTIVDTLIQVINAPINEAALNQLMADHDHSLSEDGGSESTELPAGISIEPLIRRLSRQQIDNIIATIRLHTIHIDVNRLATLPASIFDGLLHLPELQIHNNQFTELPQNILMALAFGGGALPGHHQDDSAHMSNVIKAKIPELNGTDEENRQFMEHVKMSYGVATNHEPRPVNQAEIPQDCLICATSFNELGAAAICSTDCCKQIICRCDVDTMEQGAYNLFVKIRDPEFRRIYSQSPDFHGWENIQPLATCPFCRHYPLTVSPVTIANPAQ